MSQVMMNIESFDKVKKALIDLYFDFKTLGYLYSF